MIVAVETVRVPHIPLSRRVSTGTRIMFSGATGDPLDLAADIAYLVLRFGFLDQPDVPRARWVWRHRSSLLPSSGRLPFTIWVRRRTEVELHRWAGPRSPAGAARAIV